MTSSLQGEGYSGGIAISLALAMTIAGFFAIAIYNVIEINVQIFSTFRKRSGLYFWSLCFASWGIVPHSVGFLMQYFQLCKNDYVNIMVITIGGVPMLIGQSLVLYSRLHLVVEDRRKIKWVLRMIISSFFLFNIPPTVLNLGSNSSHPEPFLWPFRIWEKVMLFGFATQEVILSSIYLWETRKMLRVMSLNRNKTTRRIIRHLIYVNILVILMDLSVIGTELGGVHVISTTYKSAVYSIKLKLEFPILNQLRDLVKRGGCTCDCPTPHILSNSTTTGYTSGPGYDPIPRDTPSTNSPFPSTYQSSSSRGLSQIPSLQPALIRNNEDLESQMTTAQEDQR